MIDSYFSIQNVYEAEVKINASVFKATAAPVSDISQAEIFLERIRKTYYDATHNCYAFIINPDYFRYSDDGEPNQSAGKPIYDVLKGSGLQEIIVIVTRYFGGTKLGVGGLVRAYSEATKLVLDRCERREILIMDRFQINYTYDDTNIIMHELEKVSGKIVTNNYSDRVQIEVDVRQSLSNQFSQQLNSASNGRIEIRKLVGN